MAEARDMPHAAGGRSGDNARSPAELSTHGWRAVLVRVWWEISEDRVLLVAGGVTFYLVLALFPALAAFVSIYGLLADPAAVSGYLGQLQGIVPAAGIEIIGTQLRTLAGQSADALGVSFILGLLVAFWSANGGVKALFDAMNIAYEEEEKRGFISLNLAAFAFTLGAFLLAVLFIVAVGIVPVALAWLGLGPVTELLVRVMRWVLIALVALAAISLLYRFGPSRAPARWSWVSVGAVIATLGWFAVSWGFSLYLQNFADYNATYGALGAVMGLLMWLWISTVVVIVGAELNAEMERQTLRDSTTGPEQPPGLRGAVVADSGPESHPAG
jgi:Predicted membrane protein